MSYLYNKNSYFDKTGLSFSPNFFYQETETTGTYHNVQEYAVRIHGSALNEPTIL